VNHTSAVLHQALVASIALIFCGTSLYAQDAKRGPASFVSLYWENDTWYDADRSYTNGVKAVWTRSIAPASRPATLPTQLLESRFPRSRTKLDYWDWMGGWSFGQLMYTPRIINDPAIQINDRPFGGQLYVGRIFTATRPDQGEQKATEHNFELGAGVSGPLSQSDDTQKWVHANIAKGAATPLGWHNQIPTEPVMQLEYSVRQRWKEWVVNGMRIGDVIPEGGGSLGTAFVQGSTGVSARFGWDLGSDFGPTRIVPVVARMGQESGNVEVYVLGRLGGRAVLRNMFLQGGGLRRAPHIVSPRLLVGDAEAAFVLRVWKVAGSFRWVRRSPEFNEANIYQSYGVLNLIVLR